MMLLGSIKTMTTDEVKAGLLTRSVVGQHILDTMRQHHTDTDTLQADLDNTPEARHGAATEQRIAATLYTCLAGIKTIELAPKHSVADDDWKLDLFITTTAGPVLAFQVKSSECAAQAAAIKYPDVPVLWMDVKDNTQAKALVDAVVAACECYLEYKDWVLEALVRRQQAKDKGMHTLSMEVARMLLSVEQRKALELLGLGRYTSNGGYALL